MNVAIVIQARMTSTRLPGKVLLPLAGKPCLIRIVERVRRVAAASRVIVATSTDPSDDAIADMCYEADVPFHRGSLHDVLGRYVEALPSGTDVVVRITGDCPVLDAKLIDHHLDVFRQARTDADYVSNVDHRTFPDGLDIEVMSSEMLQRASAETNEPADREHVTTWIRRNGRLLTVRQTVDLGDLRWTLDTRPDYEKLCAIYDAMIETADTFESRDVYRLLHEQPDLIMHTGSRSDQHERIARQLDVVEPWDSA